MELTKSDKKRGRFYGHDGLFADWAVRFQISDSRYSLDRSGEQVQRAPGSLDKMDLEVGARLDKIEKKLRRITQAP